jgi:hypothetical protein
MQHVLSFSNKNWFVIQRKIWLQLMANLMLPVEEAFLTNALGVVTVSQAPEVVMVSSGQVFAVKVETAPGLRKSYLAMENGLKSAVKGATGGAIREFVAKETVTQKDVDRGRAREAPGATDKNAGQCSDLTTKVA